MDFMTNSLKDKEDKKQR